MAQMEKAPLAPVFSSTSCNSKEIFIGQISYSRFKAILTTLLMQETSHMVEKPKNNISQGSVATVRR